MLQKKYIWVPFLLFGFFIISVIQKEVIVTWLMNSKEKVSSYETGTENSEERLASTLSTDSPESENPLDNCNFVYLDMGTNFGVQIR